MLLKHLPKKQILLFLGDVFLVAVAYFLSHLMRQGVEGYFAEAVSPTVFLVVFLYLFSFYLCELYDLRVKFGSARYLFRYSAAIVLAMSAEAVTYYLMPDLKNGRGLLLICGILVALLCLAWRSLFEWCFMGLLRRPKRVLILGAGNVGCDLYGHIKDDPNYHVVGFVDNGSSQVSIDGLPTFTECTGIEDVVNKNRVDALLITTSSPDYDEMFRYIIFCKMKGMAIVDLTAFYEELTGQVPVEHISDLWLLTTPFIGVRRGIYNKKIKRLLDIIFSIIGLIITLPVTLLTLPAIVAESGLPVFYRQTRVGLDNKLFEIIKFRSMVNDAERNGPVWASKSDPRITRVGAVIRKLRIDEIPQMWNVLKGEMSFIGPRPERPEFVKELEKKVPYYALRHFVKPGITGWAQVNYPYGASERDALEKLKYDLFYIKNLFPTLDFHILAKTVKVVLKATGAR
ncbi:MAG: sugar transferase [Geobacter sp.]|nr:sugar transferase [Geobacter sp.]